jgi:hypothetical protein
MEVPRRRPDGPAEDLHGVVLVAGIPFVFEDDLAKAVGMLAQLAPGLAQVGFRAQNHADPT